MVVVYVLCFSKPSWKDGSTAVSVLVINNTLFIANLGDSKVGITYIKNKSVHILLSNVRTFKSTSKQLYTALQLEFLSSSRLEP